MFKVVKERLVWWPVVWDVPVDGGKVEQAEIKVRFRLIDLSQLGAITAEIDALDRSDEKVVDRQCRVVMQLATDWEGVVDASDTAMPFSEENVRALMSIPALFGAFIQSYRGCVAGLPETRAKN